MKTDLFQSYGHCWIFQICWHIECSILSASTFRICNSSTWIPSPPLAFFVEMLPKAHLTSRSRMSSSRWVITPLWLSGSCRSFLFSSSVYSSYLFLISSDSVRSIPFLPFIVPIFAWNVPFVSLIFLKRSLVFPVLLFLFICTDHWGRLSYLSLLFFGILHLCIPFFFLGMVLIPSSCKMSQTSIHSSSGTLSYVIPWICLLLPLYNFKGFVLYHIWMI